MHPDWNGIPPLPAVAVVYPTHTESLLAPERDITLAAHALGLTMGLQRAGFRARAFSTGTAKSPVTEIVGPMWSLQTVRELLHQFQEFVPDVIVVEHSPLGFGRDIFVPATIAMWARSHRIDICTVSHPEPGVRSSARGERIAGAMRTSGALFAHSFAVMAHSAEWEEELRGYVPEARDAIELYEGWPLLDPSTSLRYAQGDKGSAGRERVRLAVILDDALSGSLERGLAQLDKLPAEMDVTLLAPLSAPTAAEKYEATLRRIEGNSTLTLLGDELAINRCGRTITFSQPTTLPELSRVLLESDAVLELPTRGELSTRWRETAGAYGCPYVRIGVDPGTENPSEITKTLAELFERTRSTRELRIERIRDYERRSCWRAIAGRIGAEIHRGSQPPQISADLLSASQEGIEQTAIAIGESA